MTANAMQGDRERCIAAGMNDYIAKPVTPKSLADIIERWLPVAPANPPQPAPGPTADSVVADSDAAAMAIFDRTGFVARMMGDEALARQIAAGFLDDLPSQLAALRRFLKAGDTVAFERQAHTIKGAAANVGGDAVRRCATSIEAAARTSGLSAVVGMIDELDRHFQRLGEALREFQHMEQNTNAGG